MGLHSESPDQTQAAGGIGKDPDNQSPPFDFLMVALEKIGRFQVLVMGSGEPVEGQRLLDVLLRPVAQFWVLALPFYEPRSQVLPRLTKILRS